MRREQSLSQTAIVAIAHAHYVLMREAARFERRRRQQKGAAPGAHTVALLFKGACVGGYVRHVMRSSPSVPIRPYYIDAPTEPRVVPMLDRLPPEEAV